MSLDSIIKRVTDCYAAFEGVQVVALGGSFVGDEQDSQSDLDFYVYYRDLPPLETRETALRQLAAPHGDLRIQDDWGPWWGGGARFSIEDIEVEIVQRKSDFVERIVDECLQGDYRQEWTGNTLLGYFSHCYLSDIARIRGLYDPQRLLTEWKLRIREYPPKLRTEIIRRHFDNADFMLHNPNLLRSIERADLLYVVGAFYQVVKDYVQVLFALNRTYYPGDKRNAEQIDRFRIVPPHAAERLCAALEEIPADARALNERREGLLRFHDELRLCVQTERIFWSERYR